MSEQDSKQYGEIKKGFFLRQYVGEVTTDDNKTLELSVTTLRFEPLVRYGNYAFRLSWNDIVDLAIKRGLLDTDPNEKI